MACNQVNQPKGVSVQQFEAQYASKVIKGAMLFRVALFAVAASLAGYIIFKYATSLHATEGLYALLFPFSSILALVGISFAVKPMTSCDCSVEFRAGVGGLSVAWMATGMNCVSSLANTIAVSPGAGSFAAFQMVSQHILLPMAILGFLYAPGWMLGKLGIEIDSRSPVAKDIAQPASS